jgi:hypothetical protein
LDRLADGFRNRLDDVLIDALGLGGVQFVGVDPSKNPVKEAVGNVIGKAASAGTAVADSIDQNIVKPVVEPVGKAIQSGGEGLKNLRSDDAKLADQSKFYTQDEDGNYHFGDAWSDPAKFVTRAVDVFGSLAPTILSGLITKGAVAPMVTKSMLKRGLSSSAAISLATTSSFILPPWFDTSISIAPYCYCFHTIYDIIYL